MAQDRPSKHAPQTAEDDEFLALTTFPDHIFLNATAGPGSNAMFARKLWLSSWVEETKCITQICAP